MNRELTELLRRLERFEESLGSIRQYIGARYVPKFIDDPWTDTIQYEELSVVSVGGTSYISGERVPIGTPISDRNYWHIYGASSGAIINLQNQIDNMNDGDVPGSLQAQINDNASEIETLNPLKNGYVTPQFYGAVGDGVTDDSSAFMQAINSGKIVVIPTGTYLLESQIYATDDDITMLFGGGVNITLGSNGFFGNNGHNNIALIGNGATITGVKGHNVQHTFALYNGDNITIDGFIIKNSSDDAIYVNHIDHLTINNVWIDDADRNGISIISADEFIISNTKITNINTNAPKSAIDIEPNNDADNAKLVGAISNLQIDSCQTGFHLDMHATPSKPVMITINGLVCNNNETDITYYSKEDKSISGALNVKGYVSYNCKVCPIRIADIFTADGNAVSIEGIINNPNRNYNSSVPYTGAIVDILNQADRDMGYFNFELDVVNANSSYSKYTINYQNSNSTSNKHLKLDCRISSTLNTLIANIQGLPLFDGYIEVPPYNATYSLQSGQHLFNKLTLTPASTANIDINRFRSSSAVVISNYGNGSANIRNTEGKILPVDTTGNTYVGIPVGKSITVERIPNTSDFIVLSDTL